MRLTKVLLVLTALMLLVGCTPAPIPADDNNVAPAVGGTLAGMHWVLVGMGGDDVPDVMQAWIEFTADGQVTGNGGCNGFFGDYETTEDGDLSFGMMGMTEMWCEETGDMEVSFHEYLNSVTRYVAQAGELLMYDADDNVMLAFEQGELVVDVDDGDADSSDDTDEPVIESGAPDILTGIHWNLITIEGINTLPEGMEAWIEFMDGEVSGNGGCNSFFGSYELPVDRELSFGMIGMTEMWCEATGDLEVTFHEQLKSVTGYLVRDDTLILTNADGEGVLIFESGEMRSDLGDEGIILGGELSGFKWMLVDMGLETKIHLADDIEAWIEFDDEGQVAGVSACNNFFGPYESEANGHLVFGAMGMTRMMCQDMDAIETEFHQLLSTVTMYSATDNTLLFLNANGDTIMRFEMAPDTPVSSEADELTDRNWIWTANSDDDTDPMFMWGRLLINFAENGELNGYSGCNGYFGSYERDGEGNLTFGPVGMTMMFCEDTAEQETTYHQALATVTSYTVEGNILRLYDANDEVVLRYRQDPIDASETFTRELLDSGTYQNEFAAGGLATLHHGVYREAIEDSASEIYVMLMNKMAFGDLNGDGNEQAVVVFVTSSGGTGSFYTLMVIDHDGDTMRSTVPLDLGDRIQILDLRLDGTDIVIDMIRHGEGDALCCPTEEATVRFALVDGVLIELSD